MSKLIAFLTCKTCRRWNKYIKIPFKRSILSSKNEELSDQGQTNPALSVEDKKPENENLEAGPAPTKERLI